MEHTDLALLEADLRLDGVDLLLCLYCLSLNLLDQLCDEGLASIMYLEMNDSQGARKEAGHAFELQHRRTYLLKSFVWDRHLGRVYRS